MSEVKNFRQHEPARPEDALVWVLREPDAELLDRLGVDGVRRFPVPQADRHMGGGQSVDLLLEERDGPVPAAGHREAEPRMKADMLSPTGMTLLPVRNASVQLCSIISRALGP